MYARETDDSKVDLECTLEGTETQNSVEWTKGSTVINAGGSYSISTTAKKTVLSIANPTHSGSDGSYTCKFKFTNQAAFSPTSVIALDVVCKSLTPSYCSSPFSHVLCNKCLPISLFLSL